MEALNNIIKYAQENYGITINHACIAAPGVMTKNKDFSSVRKWVTNNLDNDPVKIYRKLYETLYESLKPNSVPQMVLIIAKYQYQAAFVADHEINMVACLTEIMVECEFK